MAGDLAPSFVATLQSNQIFSGGVGLVAIGITAGAARQFFKYAKSLFYRQYMLTLEITSRDESYLWLLRWLMTHHGQSTNHIGVKTQFAVDDTGHVRTKFNLVPSTGFHIFRFRNKYFWYERSRQEQMANMRDGEPFETVKLTTLGTDRSFYTQMLEESCKLALRDIEGKTIVYKPASARWEPFGAARRKRPLESIVLDDGVAEALLADARAFLTNRDWYISRGVPYRRGYLLHGPPGCGKSSFITALAGAIDYHICVLNLSDPAMIDDRLQFLLSIAPQQSIILLEDIDAAVVGRDVSKQEPVRYQGMGRLSFSGLLNALDGVPATEGRILFMTTNYVDRLDSALIRPGRIDVRQKIDYCSPGQVQRMFARFYGQHLSAQAADFARVVLAFAQPVSAAQLQAYFLFHRDSPLSAVASAADIWKL